MPVIIEQFTQRRPESTRRPEITLQVRPGSSEIVDFLSPAKILVTCDIDDTSATLVFQQDEVVDGVMFDGDEEKDGEGKRISFLDPKTKIEDEQELMIWHLQKNRGVYIYLNSKSETT